jgi:hypothetical protein
VKVVGRQLECLGRISQLSNVLREELKPHGGGCVWLGIRERQQAELVAPVDGGENRPTILEVDELVEASVVDKMLKEELRAVVSRDT